MSFRKRIFIISILTVGAVLAIVISLSWSRIMKLELDHLDDRLCMEAKRIISINQTQNIENNVTQYRVRKTLLTEDSLVADLVDKLHIDSASQLMLFIQSSEYVALLKAQGIELQGLLTTLGWQRVQPMPLDKQKMNAANTTPKASCLLASFEHQHKQWRASYLQSPDSQSLIAVDIDATTSELQSSLREALIVIFPFSLLLSIIGSWFIATNTIKPINRLHRSMDRVTQKGLSQRLSTQDEDKEFKLLIDAYNTMLNRLEKSFQQSSRFSADAAHELKTPLTILRGKIEQAIIMDDTAQLDLNAILDEVGQLSAITRKLLLLSQSDSGAMVLHLEYINMSLLLDELTADMEILSDELTDQLVLDCKIAAGLNTKGDVVLLKQLLNNLLVNVMRYSIHEKGVTIEAYQSDAYIEVTISNFCITMPKEVRRKLFDRFYRGEPERLQGITGSGLGLSLAREIARAHGGDLLLEKSEMDVFVIRLLLPIVS